MVRRVRIFGSVLVIAAAALVTSSRAPVEAAETPVDLGAAEGFAVLGAATVTNTGSSVISGDLGVSPGSAVTGFPPGTVTNGAIHVADALAAQAQVAVTTAYNDAAGRVPTATVSAELGGQTFTSGVYTGGALGITGTVTLDAQGDPNAVFVFQAASTLITASASSVALVNGADPCNVFWQVGSSATLGTGSSLAGTVLALTSITATTGVTVDGRLLARNGAVTLDTNTVTTQDCAPALEPNLAVTKTAALVGGGTTLNPGDQLEYTVTVGSTGSQLAGAVVATDVVPSGTTFVPGSLTIGGAAVSDGAGDDAGEYDVTGGRVVVRLGTGASPTAGGDLVVGATVIVTFRVQVGPAPPAGAVVSNQAELFFRSPTTGITRTTLSDDPAVPGSADPTDVDVNDPPNAVNDTANTLEDMPVDVAVLANDSDPEGGVLQVVAGTRGAAGGSVTCSASSCTYTPAVGFTGPGAFTYEAEDPAGGRSEATVTVTVTAATGGLSITVPVTDDLGTVTAGALSLTGQLGAVSVLDDRHVTLSTWTVTVTSTDFTTGAGSPHEHVPATDVSYDGGPAAQTSGPGTFTPGPGGPLDEARVAVSWLGLIDPNRAGSSASWRPTLHVLLRPDLVAGPYVGTITHSVA
jgi:uncharacterized repeat protein (TIGR01451 family)